MALSAEDAAVGRLRAAVRRLAVQTQARARTGRSHDDADDAKGTVDTDDAHGFDPLPLLQALHEHGARVAVIGQVAGIMHGSQELTGDLDLLWDGVSEQAPALAAAFGSVTAPLPRPARPDLDAPGRRPCQGSPPRGRTGAAGRLRRLTRSTHPVTARRPPAVSRDTRPPRARP